MMTKNIKPGGIFYSEKEYTLYFYLSNNVHLLLKTKYAICSIWNKPKVPLTCRET